MDRPLVSRRIAVLGAACAAALPWHAQAAGDAVELEWTDATRGNRRLPLLLRWPAGDAPVALILHSHGLGGSRHGGAAWGSAWAEAGFAVLHLQHPGSDTAVFRGGIASARAAASGEQLIARAADARFVLDEIERLHRSGSGPWRRVRLDAIGFSGHSFGAATTLAVAGQRYLPGDVLADPRPRAFAAFSPAPPRAGAAAVAAAFAPIVRPVFVLTGSLDGDPLDGGRDPARRTGDYRAAVFDALPRGQRALLWLDGADHMSFGGGRPGEGDREARLPGRLAALRRERVAREREPAHHALIRRASTAWWRAQLLGDADAAAFLRSSAWRQTLGEGDRFTID
jgi:hypothetical protein